MIQNNRKHHNITIRNRYSLYHDIHIDKHFGT